MRSIQSRLVNQTILMVNRTLSIQQILFDSIQSIQSRVNQTPVWFFTADIHTAYQAPAHSRQSPKPGLFTVETDPQEAISHLQIWRPGTTETGASERSGNRHPRTASQ